jgi:hypothetical protein
MRFSRFAKNQIERTNGKTLGLAAARRTPREGGPMPPSGKVLSPGKMSNNHHTFRPGRWQGWGRPDQLLREMKLTERFLDHEL